jgi:uncharacterized protein HemX
MEPEARRICYFRAGETGELLGSEHIRHPDGNVYRLADCMFEADASVHLEEPDHMDPAALPAPAPEAPPVAEAPASAHEPEAAIAVPDPTTAASELQGLVGAAGGDSTLAIALAAIAVLGGGAAWKFYSQQTKQSHELKMKELEMKSQTPSQSPPPCILKHGELDAKVAALEAQVEKVAAKAKAAGLPAGFDAEEIETRIEKLEKAAAAKKKV